uniref:Pentacotripeptide-repeat region of PRORP domain-containing protein n=1 Tax=Salix viminalis TaxID=40686 RepID=A0A6N2KFS8_SALVM
MLINSIPKPNFLLSKIVDLKDWAYASIVFNHLTKPNIYAFNVMLPCGNVGGLVHGKIGHCLVFKTVLDGDEYVNHSLIPMYARCGEMGFARKVFDEMGDRGLVSWNSMISGCAQNGASNEAIVLFNEMREAGPNPDKVTMIEVLSACSTVGALDLGKWIETHASERGLQHDVHVASALIDMYAKCGSLDDAIRVFESMPHKNEVSWNAMISALAFHGQAQEALSLFWRMSKVNDTVHPNDITFIGVLSACVHAGLVDEGRQLFESMSLSFGLVPKVEHYSCMVYLCARAGLLYEAWDLIKKMPGKPDEIVLGSLLGACQRCRNADVGERVIQLFLEQKL